MIKRRGFGEYARRTLKTSVRETGTFAYAMHRMTGVLLTIYLFIHISTMSMARFQGQTFEEFMATFRQPLFLIVDWFIFLGVLIHGLNGIRITLFDLGIGIRRQATVFWGLMALGGVVALAGLVIILPEVMGGL
ncbi:MAG: succinate dehydrogenase, cytochrome b556 subunit [Thermoplasmata archaeon]